MHLDCFWVDDASGRPNVSTWKKLCLRRGIDQGCVATLVRGIDQICKAWQLVGCWRMISVGGLPKKIPGKSRF